MHHVRIQRRAALRRLVRRLPLAIALTAVLLAMELGLARNLVLSGSSPPTLVDLLRKIGLVLAIPAAAFGFLVAYWPRLDRLTELCPTAEGFKWLHGRRIKGQIRWNQVLGIAAHLEPTVGIVDVVYLSFRLRDDVWIEFSEHTPGFEWLCAAIAEHRGVVPGWREALVLAPTWLTLWGIAYPPGNCCVRCNYNLTGNASGRCPEYGIECRWPVS